MDDPRTDLLEVVKLAYGLLWHVNIEPAAPVPVYTPEQAAHEVRRLLLDHLSKDERRDAIQRAGEVLGRFPKRTETGKSHRARQ